MLCVNNKDKGDEYSAQLHLHHFTNTVMRTNELIFRSCKNGVTLSIIVLYANL